MQTISIYVFTTFVLLSNVAVAAPGDLPPNDEPIVDDESKKSELPRRMDTLQITDAPENKEPVIKEYIYNFNQSLSPRVGILYTSDRLSNLELPYYVLGMNFMLPSESNRHWEIGADVVSNASGHFNVTWKWVYNESASFRPHLKAGIALLATPVDGLASFLRWKNYHATFAVGFEDVINDPMSVRFDLEVVAGAREMAGLLVFGYSWAWK